MSSVETVRSRLLDAIAGGRTCPHCGRQEREPLTVHEVSRRVAVKYGVVRRFAKGGDILASHLALIEAGLEEALR